MSLGLLAPAEAQESAAHADHPACAPRNPTDVADTVTRILVEHLGVEAAQVSPAANLTDDLGADSLDVVELVLASEEAFNIELPDDVAERIKTVQDLIEVIVHSCPLPPPSPQEKR